MLRPVYAEEAVRFVSLDETNIEEAVMNDVDTWATWPVCSFNLNAPSIPSTTRHSPTKRLNDLCSRAVNRLANNRENWLEMVNRKTPKTKPIEFSVVVDFFGDS